MKKLVIITGTVVYLLFAISAFIAIAQENNSAAAPVAYTPVYPSTQSSARAEIYIVKSKNGVIVVEEEATGKIIQRTDTPASVLPLKDQQRLEKGIRVRGSLELRRALEDFCS